MGYYIRLMESTVCIAPEQLPRAYDALVRLNDRNDLKSGGRYPRDSDITGPHPDRWFSWMEWNYPDHCATAQAVLEAVGFECSVDEFGNLWLDGYDQKAGDEDKFLTAIAPFVPDGCTMTWQGEEGELWRLVFHAGTISTQAAKIVWD